MNFILKNIMSMLTKESIVQRLFNEGLITAEEAVVLLKTEVIKWLPGTDQNQWIGPGIPSYPAQPYMPISPISPIQPINVPYCDWTSWPNGGTGNPNPVSFTTTYAAPGINKNQTDK